MEAEPLALPSNQVMKVSMVKLSGRASPPVEGAAEGVAEGAVEGSASGVATGLEEAAGLEGLAAGAEGLLLALGAAEGVLGLVGVVPLLGAEPEPPEPKRGGPGTV